ncbi:hypothetical protein HUT11_35305 (plasmid) [Streptomyces seoulensis]|nr:hypothetical protein HUT11_35305 [Streptomyces seoulensis]
MPQGIEAPAAMQAEGPTQHTQNQAARLSAYQLRMLHGGINPNRVRNLRGLAHLEAWDVRRQLIRVFGFGGFSIETLSLDLVHNHGQEGFRRKNKQGDPYGDPFTAWTVVYRAQVRLTVFDVNGREVSHWEDGAAGDAVNQPSVGDAHDMAMKTAFSQALKRCAVNLGDQFGLSLYNDGSRDAVVCFSAAHPPQEWKQAAPPQPEPEDPPVKPEPGAKAAADAEAEQGPASEPRSGQEESREQALARLTEQYRNCWGNQLALSQIRLEGKKLGLSEQRVQGPPPESAWTTFDKLLADHIAELEAERDGRAAA